MERTKFKETDKVYWKNTGSTFRLPGKIIKPGEIFQAPLNEIPVAFRDVLICQQGEIESISQAKKEPVKAKPVFSLVEKGGNWYDVVNADGKPLNEKSLRKKDAEELIETLNK